MSKARNDRNFIKIGTTKKDDKEWDRLEDRLQTDPNLGGGGPPELLVPGTYVPVVGLPPGVPYLYVIGNLITNYPIDLTATSPLSPNIKITTDRTNFFGLGIETVLGVSSLGTAVVAVKPPASPVISATPGPPAGTGFQADDGLLSADGTIFRMFAGINPGDPTLLRYKLLVRQPDSSWYLLDLSADPVIGYGDASDVAGNFIVKQSTTTPGAIDISNVDSTGTETTYQTDLDTGITPRRAIVENGFIIVHDKLGIPFYASAGNIAARPSSVTAVLPFINVGSVFSTTAVQPLEAKNISIGPTGVAWISHQSESYFTPITNAVVRADLINGTIERFPDVLYDNTLTYEIQILDTLYIADNICAVSGYYTIPAVGDVPIIAYIVIDAFNNVSVNLLEFPDYLGTGSAVYSMVKVGTTLVFHLYSSALDVTSSPVSILFAVNL